MKNDIGRKIRQARVEAGLTMEEIASQVGVSQASISRWENGKQRPAAEFIPKLAAMTNKSLDFFWDLPELEEGTVIPPSAFRIEGVEVPVYGAVPAGGGGYVSEEPIGLLEVTPEMAKIADYVVLVSGLCLEPRFHEGDFLAFKTDLQPRPYDIVVAYFPRDETVGVKIYRREGLRQWLETLDGERLHEPFEVRAVYVWGFNLRSGKDALRPYKSKKRKP